MRNCMMCIDLELSLYISSNQTNLHTYFILVIFIFQLITVRNFALTSKNCLLALGNIE